MGEADAKASEVYASAYASSPRAAEFYSFVKTLETYRETLGRDATLVLTTDSDFFRLLKGIPPLPADGSVAPILPAQESVPLVPQPVPAP